MQHTADAQGGASQEQTALSEATGSDGRRLKANQQAAYLQRSIQHEHLAGGCAKQDANTALFQASERLLERVFANAIKDSVYSSTT